jgi:small-conductance mechanosensitive channel
MVQVTTRPLFETAAKLFFFAVAVYFILISWGINPVGWLASAGIVAVAVGLAAQDALGNLFAGISILADAPYKLGDYIVLDGNERGKVTKIGLRSTRILTRDDIEIIIPNTLIANSKIINESGGPSIRQRMRIPVGVAYGSDIETVKKVLLDAVRTQEAVSSRPEPWVRFNGFGESSLDFDIRCWINDPARRGRVLDAINCGVYDGLNQAGIEIPFPKRDLYIKELPEGFRLP